MLRRLVLLLLPVAATLLVAHHGGAGSPLHAQLAPWPAAQEALQHAHGSTKELLSALSGEARRAHIQLDALLQRHLPPSLVAALPAALRPGAAAGKVRAGPPRCLQLMLEWLPLSC